MAYERSKFHADFISHNTTILLPSLIKQIHFNLPWVLLVVFLVAFLGNSISRAEKTAPTTNAIQASGPGGKPLPVKNPTVQLQQQDFSRARKHVFLWLSAGLIFSFVASLTNVVLHALVDREEGWWCGEATCIYLIASAFFYSVLQISLVDTSPSPTIAHLVTWGVGCIFEITLLGATIALYTGPHEELNSLRDSHEQIENNATHWEVIEITIDAFRVILFLLLIGFFAIFSHERSVQNRVQERGRDTDETAPLIINGHANSNDQPENNGTIVSHNRENGHTHQSTNPVSGHESGGKSPDPAFYKPRTVPKRTWWEYLRGYAIFFPYLWPSKSFHLKIVVVICFTLTMLQRVVNVAVPWQVGNVVKELRENETFAIPWGSVCLFILFKFLQGNSGILGATRSVLWIPISQYSYQALSTASFEHVHSLSLDFHLGKRTGEVISALSKGNAINNFLEQITFQMLPMLLDLGVAIVYFGVSWDAYYALIVGMITFAYLYLTIRMAQWRSEQRREMNNLSREEDAVKNDSLQSYETVKYFNAETYEFKRYRDAVTAYQRMEFQVIISLNILNISQNLVFMAGLLSTSLLAAYQITTKQRPVEDFMILLTYMTQLQGPLNFFGSFYRGIQAAMISGERLLELFKEQATVVDNAEVQELPGCEGQIRFDGVKFSYDKRKPAIEDLTFTCTPGTTTAFVGESGGGKSTVFRLLFRFYNIQGGSIQVDGHDVRDVTIDSLRRHIGVVPQDTVLFNESLMYNLKYANPSASDEDVYDACRAASIHEKILAFPDGYATTVGERGLRLSGGEKQRVAIARTIIKNPRIIMLDEATAALDSATEQNIQNALKTLSKGRTMLVIALSTITGADQILVMHAGRVAESGTHEELLQLKGRYYKMWGKQIRAEQAADQAAHMMAVAKALQESSMAGPGGSEEVSDNEGDSTIIVEAHNDDMPTSDRGTIASDTKTVVHEPLGNEPLDVSKPDTAKSTGHNDTTTPS